FAPAAIAAAILTALAAGAALLLTERELWRDGLLLAIVVAATAVAVGLGTRESRRRVEADALLHGFVETPPLVMTLRDPQGRYLMANPRFCQYVGKREDEIIGRGTADIFGPEQGAR